MRRPPKRLAPLARSLWSIPLLACLGFAGLAGLPRTAHASSIPDCFPPGAPSIPDGNSASYPEMVRTGQQIKLFRETAATYMSCMEDRLKLYGPRVPERRREKWVKEQQKVAESVQTAIDRYNQSVRDFKARSDTPKAETAPRPEGEPKSEPAVPEKTGTEGKSGT